MLLHATESAIGGTHETVLPPVYRPAKLLHFAGNGKFLSGCWFADDQGVVDLGHLAFRKLNVYNGTDDLRNVANALFFCGGEHACAHLCNQLLFRRYGRTSLIVKIAIFQSTTEQIRRRGRSSVPSYPFGVGANHRTLAQMSFCLAPAAPAREVGRGPGA